MEIFDQFFVTYLNFCIFFWRDCTKAKPVMKPA